MRILTTLLSLAFAVVSFSQSDCGWQPDSDENNFISVTDILAILAVFGQADADQDGIWDASDVCIDPEACNYAADPSVPCEFLDAAGICGGSNDIPALLIGSWALSTAAGAVEVGPSPGSNEWYSSGSNGLQSAQYDDIYTFQTNGSLIADYNGSIIDALQITANKDSAVHRSILISMHQIHQVAHQPLNYQQHPHPAVVLSLEPMMRVSYTPSPP